MLHMFGEFKGLGFHIKEYNAYQQEDKETERALVALQKLSQSTDVGDDKEAEDGQEQLMQLVSPQEKCFNFEVFSQLQYPFEEEGLQRSQLYVRFNMEDEDISTIHSGLD